VGACAWAAIVAASVVLGSAATAACPPSSMRNCVVDLNLAPEATQQIVAGEAIPAPPAKAPPVVPIPAYTGPLIGAAPNMGRAPEIGFRWETN
jgi:hypothetical protein